MEGFFEAPLRRQFPSGSIGDGSACHPRLGTGDAVEDDFPEAIITGRGAVVRQWGNKFLGLSMVFNFTNIGDKENLAVQNIKWRIRTFFGLRLGKR